MMNNTVLIVFLQLVAAVLLCLPTVHSFSLVALPRCPATVWRARSLHLRAGAFECEFQEMSRCGDALCQAGDEIVAAAAILGENRVLFAGVLLDWPASLSAGGCSIANAGRDARSVAAALRDNEWASACGPLKTCAGSLFGAAASLADVCSAGAALGEAGLEIEDASLVLRATAGPSLTSAGESLASAGGALGAYASQVTRGGGVYAQAGARLFSAGGALAAAGEALEKCGSALEKGGN
jgi:hypothetical protein